MLRSLCRSTCREVADIRNGAHIVAATPGRLLDVMDSGCLAALVVCRPSEVCGVGDAGMVVVASPSLKGSKTSSVC